MDDHPRRPMRPCHEDDPMARLDALCRRECWLLGVAVIEGGRLTLRVHRPDTPYVGAVFEHGRENAAAAELIYRLQVVA